MSKYNLIVATNGTWMHVTLTELVKLGIQDAISTKSYINGDNVYLSPEDMQVFMTAKNDLIDVVDKVSNRKSRITGYNMYGGDRMVTRVNFMTGQEYQERADTPYYASARSETYWSS